MWKKHQTLMSNNDDAQSIRRHGTIVRLDTPIVAPRLIPPLAAIIGHFRKIEGTKGLLDTRSQDARGVCQVLSPTCPS